MTREPKVWDVYSLQLKNNIWENIEWYESLHIIQEIWFYFVKVKVFWLLFRWLFLMKPIKNMSRWVETWLIENIYNPMWLLDRTGYKYYWQLAPRYKRIFGIYLIKNK